MSESTKKREREKTITHGRPQKFFQGDRQHFVYHFQLLTISVPSKINFTLNKYLF